MTPTICPTSPRPRVCHPGTKEIFKPGPFSTSGNHVNENAMLLDTSFRDRKSFIGSFIHDLETAAIHCLHVIGDYFGAGSIAFSSFVSGADCWCHRDHSRYCRSFDSGGPCWCTEGNRSPN